MKFRHGSSLEGSVKVLKHDHQRETFFSPLDYVVIIHSYSLLIITKRKLQALRLYYIYFVEKKISLHIYSEVLVLCSGSCSPRLSPLPSLSPPLSRVCAHTYLK